MQTVGGIVFPGSPLAATKAELRADGRVLAGHREVARRGAAAAEGGRGRGDLRFELLNRNVDQPYKYVGTWLIDQWSKIGVHATQKVVPTGPWFEAMRSGDFDVVRRGQLQQHRQPAAGHAEISAASVVAENYGGYEDPTEVDIYDKMLHETDPPKQRVVMRRFETYVVDTQAHEFWSLWWYRIVPYRSYVKGWKISPEPLHQPGSGDDLAGQIDRRQRRTDASRTGGDEKMRIATRRLRWPPGLLRRLALALPAHGRRDAEARRHPDLHDPGRRAAELRRATRGNLRDDPCGGAVLQRADPRQPDGSRLDPDMVCDLCTEMPKPTDDGKTYTFKIRQGVKFHDGSPLTAADVAGELEQDHLPAGRRRQPAREQLS